MPVVQGPLLSIDAAGTLNKTITYQRRNTTRTARSKPTPPAASIANLTESQLVARYLHQWLVRWEFLRGAPAYLGTFLPQNTTTLQAGLNQRNIRNLRADHNVHRFAPFPIRATSYNPPPTVVTPGVGSVAYSAATAWSPKNGQTAQRELFVISDIDPTTPQPPFLFWGSATPRTPAMSGVISGLISGANYVLISWVRFQPDPVSYPGINMVAGVLNYPFTAL